MKYLFILSFFLLSLETSAQTAVIATKSHSGDFSLADLNKDKFGLREPDPVIDSVILIDNNCVIEIGSKFWQDRYRDTICNHYSLQQSGFTLSAAERYYGANVTLIGFPNDKPDPDREDNPFYRNVNEQGFGLLFILLTLSGLVAYIFFPARTKQ